jgi:predicted DNA-binding ribbon-helix-helix protein
MHTLRGIIQDKGTAMQVSEVTTDKTPIIEAGLQTTRQYALQSHNVRIAGRRTSVRLEPQMWAALNEIADMEKCSVHDLCTAVYELKETRVSFTASLRVFLMEYYRAALKSDGKVTQITTRIKSAQDQKMSQSAAFK